MMLAQAIFMPLLAQATKVAETVTSNGAASGVTRTTYRFSRLQWLTDERWHLVLVVAIVLAILAYVFAMYRRDSVELRWPIRSLLVALRLVALLGALFFFLDLEKRTEVEVVHNSRVLLLVDTSQSMGIHDSDSSPVPATPSRIDQVVAELSGGKLIRELRKVHDVVVVRFDRDTSRVVSLEKYAEGGSVNATPTTNTNSVDAKQLEAQKKEAAVDWQKALLPQGAETRLGSALTKLLDAERGTPVSAIVVITDGGQNSGVEPGSAVEIARAAKIPIYTVGIGSDQQPVNLRVSDLVAPSRAYPGDSFTITGYVQAQGLENRTVTVELLSRDAADKAGVGTIEQSERVTLGTDGTVLPVKFEIESKETGRRTYRLRVAALPEDRNPQDDQQEVDVEIIDRKSQVLLLASAATREYRFICSQLRREKDMVVDVLLQSSQPGISQDANEVLDEFPTTKEELYKYDTIYAFDANWNELTSDQIDLLEAWVAEEAGGLVIVAGPIYTDQLGRTPSLVKVRNLYPVEFQRRFTVLTSGDYDSKAAWPIEFTREGVEAEFLWIRDSLAASQSAWASFKGVFGYYAVSGAKPGATVYARFSNPETEANGELPVYMAGHLYGSGRVFYLGSGELWRLRSIDESYFEQFYTKLTRHVSQGRLLRGSSRGVLLVERDRYLLGDTVVVRAQLSNAAHDPLDVPNLTLHITQPDSTTPNVVLKPDPTRKGMYSGQFTVLQEGVFRLDLPVPETVDEQLTRRFQVRVPDLERENPRRNDALLSELAHGTGGVYYVGLDAALGRQGIEPLVPKLRNQKETTLLAGSPDRHFERLQMNWILGIICGALCLEWLVRRLNKLA